MIKKIIIIVLLALVGYFMIFVVPDLIREKKNEEEIKATEMQKRAEERARQTVGDKIGVTGGSAGFGGKFTEKAKVNVDKAAGRSADYQERIEE